MNLFEFFMENMTQILIFTLSFLLIFTWVVNTWRVRGLKKENAIWIAHSDNQQQLLDGRYQALENLKDEHIGLLHEKEKLAADHASLKKDMTETNIQLINAKGEILRLKVRRKEVSHAGVVLADPTIASEVYRYHKGWRTKIGSMIGYVAGWNMISNEVILGFYVYTGINNIAITSDCIMSNRDYIDYVSITVNQLREMGFE